MADCRWLISVMDKVNKFTLLSYQLSCQLGLIAIRQWLLHGQDHAVGDDGEQDGILKGGPLDEEFGGSSEVIGLGEDKEGRRSLLLFILLLLLAHG